MKLTIGNGTAVESNKSPHVSINGGCVTMVEREKDESGNLCGVSLLLAYCLRPGETVRRTADGDYDVQF